jgi:LysM repeat protein
MMKNKLLRLCPFFLVCILLSACQSTGSGPSVASVSAGVTPYFTVTSTPLPTATSLGAPTATAKPTATATPQIYVLKGSETLWTIAAKAGITLDEIKAANPGIDAHLLKAGMKIIIPAASAADSGQTGATPTAVALKVSELNCTPSLTGGEYCFASVANDQSFTIQNFSAQFILTDSQSGETQVEPALLPLDHLTASSNLPIFAYFPPPVPSAFTAQVEVDSASADSTTNSTYLPVQVASKADIAADGLSAVVTGTVTSAKAASKYWLAAVAYDAQGSIVAVRQMSNKANLSAGASADFTLYIYSIGAAIDKVDVFAEATP